MISQAFYIRLLLQICQKLFLVIQTLNFEIFSGISFPDSEPYDPNTTELLANWPKSICQSPLWDAEIRNEVKKTKISEAQLNMKRSEMLNIGQRLEVGRPQLLNHIFCIELYGLVLILKWSFSFYDVHCSMCHYSKLIGLL